jgi:hypothetical protein
MAMAMRGALMRNTMMRVYVTGLSIYPAQMV